MGVLGDRYDIDGALYESKHTVVLRARDTMLDRTVAIKVPAGDDAASLSTVEAVFAREAKALAMLEHPAIISLYDYYSIDGRPALVLRYLSGSLAALAPPIVVLRAARDIAAALDYCAEKGIAHRDVKPGNILLDESGRASLIDFGIAAAFDDAKNWQSIVGSMPFIAPELLISKLDPGAQTDRPDARRRYDQFGLGVTLYQALTGKLPHDPKLGGRSPEWDTCTAYRMMAGEEPVPANERSMAATPAAYHVLRRMMAIDPDRRFASCQEAVATLDDAMRGRGAGRRKVFVSYARSDRDYVTRLVEELRRRGVDAWWDADMLRGLDWEEQIEEHLLDAELMLIVLSPDSARSPEVKVEWRYWINLLKKPVLTVVTRDCRIPFRLFPLQHILATDRSPESLAIDVAASIERLLPPVAAPPAPPTFETILPAPPAADWVANAPVQDGGRLLEVATGGVAFPSKEVALDLPRTLTDLPAPPPPPQIRPGGSG
jgi:Protein kinase domain/TIR domain